MRILRDQHEYSWGKDCCKLIYDLKTNLKRKVSDMYMAFEMLV